MLNKVNKVLMEQYQNFYMSNSEQINKNSNEQNKQYRSFEQFNNFCKKYQLIAELLQDQQENPKVMIINLMLLQNNNTQPIKFEYYFKNNQEYYHNHLKQFKALKQFLDKYIITKTGQKKYPICILG